MPTGSDTHECPVNGCTRRVAADQLMCPVDWRRLPPAVKREVWVSYDNGHGRGTSRHNRAIGRAIDAANQTR